MPILQGVGRSEDQLLTPERHDTSHEIQVRGRLSFGWQLMIGATWVAAFFAFASVWKASEEIGIGTWWLGPRAQPQPTLVRLIPFSVCIVVVVAAMYNPRRLWLVSAFASIGLAAIAAADVSRSGGLAAIEFAIAAAVLLVSLASVTGVRRGRQQQAQTGRLAPGDPLPPPSGPPA